MVLCQVQPILQLTLPRYPGPHDLREAVVVSGANVKLCFYLVAEPLGEWFTAEQSQSQGKRGEVDAHLLALLGKVERVAGRGNQNGGAEVPHHHQVPSGVSGARRNNGRPYPLESVVQSPATGKHTVQKRHVDEVALGNTGH